VGPLVSGTGSLVSWDKSGIYTFVPEGHWYGEYAQAQSSEREQAPGSQRTGRLLTLF